MSWKSLVITGLLCVVASPVLAAPTLSIDLVKNGGAPVLNDDGEFQWLVSVSPDAALFTTTGEGTGGSLALELGLDFTGLDVTGYTVNTTNWDKENFGNSPFAFGENPADGVTQQGNQIFAALGSTFFTSADAKEVMTVTTAGPTTVGPDLTTSVSWLGDYGGNARIAQGGETFDTFVGSASFTAIPGDANLDGSVGIADFNIWLSSAGTNWDDADFNDDNSVGIADFNIWLSSPGGSGSIAAAAVPEPASVALVLFGLAFVAGRRQRS